jgi:arylsulfatase A-like enzyme
LLSFSVLSILLLAAAASGCEEERGPATAAGATDLPQSAPELVVVYLIDALRADHTGPYGGDVATPNLDALAARGTVFEQAYAPAPWTLPSLVSLLSGVHACRHGVLDDRDRVARRRQLLATWLNASGWATASFHQNPYAGLARGVARGYDHAEAVAFDARAGARALAWIDQRLQRGDQRLFIYIHTVEPHDPYRPPDALLPPGIDREQEQRINRLLRRYRKLTRVDFAAGRAPGSTDNSDAQRAVIRAIAAEQPAVGRLYAAEVVRADRDLGRFVAGLRRREVWEHTLLVVLSDHGEELGDHGGWEHDQSVYEELLRVPWLICRGAGDGGGRRVAAPVSGVDLVPTLLDLLDIGYDPDRFDGTSLAGCLRGEPAPAQPRVLALRRNRKKYYRPWAQSRGPDNAVVRRGRWKLIWNQGPGTTELYDLRVDPQERRDRATAEPGLRAGLLQVAQKALAGCRPDDAAEADAAEPDGELREQLRALGYTE